jgi:hypothetical protein
MWVDDLVKESKKLIHEGKKAVRGLSREDQELVGMLAAKVVGDQLNKLYESCTPEHKALWEELRLFHHGDLGYMIAEDGKKKRDSLLLGAGKGLMLSDIKDRDKWMLHKAKTTTKSKRRTTHR